MTGRFAIALPEDWKWLPLKFTTKFLNRGTAPDYVDDGPVRAVGQAANQAVGLDWTRTRFHSDNGAARQLKGYLFHGDVLINSTGTGTLGRVGYFAGGPDSRPCIADGHITVARADEKVVCPRYLYYWLTSKTFYDYAYSALVVGATNQIELNRDRLANAPVGVPSLAEQRRIVNLLDVESDRIRALAARNQISIALAEERVNSEIGLAIGESQLVRGGIGDVTEIRRLLKKLSRPAKACVDVVTAFRDGQVTARARRRAEGYTESASSEPHAQGVEVGDVVIHGLDGFSGAIGDAESAGKCSPVYHVCAQLDGGSASFYGRMLRLLALDGYLSLFATSTRERAVDFRNWDRFSRIEIPVVPLNIQHRLGASIEQVRPLREVVQQMNARLAERRQALITAAVTGQIDVSTARGADV